VTFIKEPFPTRVLARLISLSDMARARVEKLMVARWRSEGSRRGPDYLIVEEPLTIRLDEVVVSTTMRTPGNDFELAVGWCVTDGLIRPEQVSTVRYCGTGSAMETEFNVVSVHTLGGNTQATPRLSVTSSSCGWCGSEQIDEALARLGAMEDSDPIDPEVLITLPDAVRSQQELFAKTGAVHAAASFDSEGRIGLLREDVGRHNAVDKLVGALALSGGLPATHHGLYVSGRASVEMVHKAWAAGFTTLISMSAPTALAVETARRANMALAGFITTDQHGALRMNIYAP
jgi:FdhD protein